MCCWMAPIRPAEFTRFNNPTKSPAWRPSRPNMALRETSGQALLIVVFIMLILLISVPIVVFLNQTVTQHQFQSNQRIKGRAIAEEGISYATQQISATLTQWQKA